MMSTLLKLRSNIFITLTLLTTFCLLLQLMIFHTNPFSGLFNLGATHIFGGDFRSYYFGTMHLLAGETPYFPANQHMVFPLEPAGAFVYPPLMTVLISPFTILPLQVAYITLVILSIIAWAASVFIFSNQLQGRKSFIALALLTSAISPALLMHIERGQTDIFILLVIASSYVALKNNKSILAGVLIGLAGALKLTPLIYLAYFFLTNRTAFFSALATTAIGFIIFPRNMLVDFYQKITQFSSNISGGVSSDSLTGAIRDLIATVHIDNMHIVKILTLTIAVTVLFATLFITRNQKKHSQLYVYGILSSLMILIPGTSWVYNSVHLLPLFVAYWIIRARHLKQASITTTFDTIAFLIISEPIFSPYTRSLGIYHIFSLRPFFILSMIGLCLYELYRHSPQPAALNTQNYREN